MSRCTTFWGFHRWGVWTKAVLKRREVTYSAPTWTSTPHEEDVWFQERSCDRCGLAQHRYEVPR